jgi:hypothetical protein
MNLTIGRLVVIAILIGFSLTGCMDHKILRKPQLTTDPEYLPILNFPNSVAIIKEPLIMNEEVLVCEDIPHRYYVTSEGLTDASVYVLKDIFVRNNVEINNNGNKQLKLSIVEANCEPGVFTLNYITKIKVIAGDNINKTFSGNQTSPHNTYTSSWAIEKAIISAVLEMLKDPEIINYLQY